MNLPIKIIAVDDHQLFREAIVSKLEENSRYKVIGQIDNAIDTLIMVREKRPDIVLLDISLDGMDGLETARLIQAAELNIKIIMLSMHTDHQYIGAALALNVDGYVKKQEAFDDLVKAIEAVYSGERYFSSSLHVNELSLKNQPAKQTEAKLTQREIDIVKLVSKGLTNQEISQLENISIKTIETHRANINRKLNARNSADVTRYAIRQGFISP